MTQSSKRDKEECSIIALDKFIQATRDSGYKGTASAVSELVDNSIQAGATSIAISLVAVGEESLVEFSLLDDGCGMDPFTLRQALRFGGTTRFGDRKGLGRYGMGLPNASLSQARRVTVFTWQSPARTRVADRRRSRAAAEIYSSYLDVDEIVDGRLDEVPRPKLVKEPPFEPKTRSGTLVLWTKCDRLDNARISTTVRKLDAELARRFRHFLWNGLRITINGESIVASDPLYLESRSHFSGASIFGDELRYEVRADPIDPKIIGTVRVRFSELPVYEWHKLSNDEKRRRGISKGAGVSIVRAGREVDYGWFFMGAKHRENYDDWWRCEVHFDPILDEAFGVTHTKQQVRPQPHLIQALSPDLEATARALNARARKAHVSAKAEEQFSEAERIAGDRDRRLPPLPDKPSPKAKALMNHLQRTHPALQRSSNRKEKTPRYRIVESAIDDTDFFSYASDGERLVLVLNPAHPFYLEIYRQLIESDTPREAKLRAKVELLLLAAARSEAISKGGRALERYRREWSNTLAAFLND